MEVRYKLKLEGSGSNGRKVHIEGKGFKWR